MPGTEDNRNAKMSIAEPRVPINKTEKTILIRRRLNKLTIGVGLKNARTTPKEIKVETRTDLDREKIETIFAAKKTKIEYLAKWENTIFLEDEIKPNNEIEKRSVETGEVTEDIIVMIGLRPEVSNNSRAPEKPSAK